MLYFLYNFIIVFPKFSHSDIYFEITLFVIKSKWFQVFIISASLKCSMGIQSSDGRGMLLKYVTSYVTKMKDHNIFQGLIIILYIWISYVKILQIRAFSKLLKFLVRKQYILFLQWKTLTHKKIITHMLTKFSLYLLFLIKCETQ